MSISLKEANETDYWLCLLVDTNYLDKDKNSLLLSEVKELIAMLVATIKTMKAKK